MPTNHGVIIQEERVYYRIDSLIYMVQFGIDQ
jgi:hypothetical protein